MHMNATNTPETYLNATNAFCTIALAWDGTQMHRPDWGIPPLLTAITTTSLPPNIFSLTKLAKLLSSPSPIFPPLLRLNKLVLAPPLPPSPLEAESIHVACGQFRPAPPTLTRATTADIRGLSPPLYHQWCRQGCAISNMHQQSRHS